MKILKIITKSISSKFITHPSSGADMVKGPCWAVGIFLDLISANREDWLLLSQQPGPLGLLGMWVTGNTFWTPGPWKSVHTPERTGPARGRQPMEGKDTQKLFWLLSPCATPLLSWPTLLNCKARRHTRWWFWIVVHRFKISNNL